MSPSKRAGCEKAFLALGSNLGDRLALLRTAVTRLSGLPSTRLLAVSRVYETEPVGPITQGRFLNAAAALETSLDPLALLRLCLKIESELGRVRTIRWGPRPIDIDLLLHGQSSVSDLELQLPHPRMLERAFVLVPLAEIAPDELVSGHAIREWAARSDRSGLSLFEAGLGAA